jgi:histidinol phosphatase-like PHP family hydrolase
MAIPRIDYHIHTHYLGCANETMQLPAILAECQRVGVKSLAITDHLNTLETLHLHRAIRDELASLETDLDVYLGVELNFLGPDQGFAYSEAVRDEIGFQFAIGGIHGTYLDEYDPKRLVEIQHRHHIKTCEDPLVSILVHPYWYPSGEFERKGFPWVKTMSMVPDAYVRELAQASKDTGTAIEINACACLVSPRYGRQFVAEYEEYVRGLADEGATFSLSSDAHRIDQLQYVSASWELAERVGLSEEQIWRPEWSSFL